MVKINFLYSGGAQENNNMRFSFSSLWLLSLFTLAVLTVPSILHSAPGPDLTPPTILIPETAEIVTSRQPYIKGVTLNKSLVDIYVDGIYNGRARVKDHPSGTASWAYQVFLPLEYGTHEVFAVARSQDEIFRSAESIHAVFELEQPLPAPRALSLEANPKNWQQPALSGISKTSDQIEIFVDGVMQQSIKPTANLDNDFVFSYSPPKNLEPGWHSFKARSIDPRGKYSQFSRTLVAEVRDKEFTPLTAPALRPLAAQGPSRVSAPTLLAPETSSVHSSAKPSIAGLAHNQQRLEIFVDAVLNGEIQLGSHQSGVVGFKYKPFLKLQPGTHAAKARAIAPDGQKSGWSNTVSFFIRSTKSDYLVTASSVVVPASNLTTEAGGESVLASETKSEDASQDLPQNATSSEELASSLTDDQIIIVGATTTAEKGTSSTLLIIILAIVVIIIVGIISWLTTRSSNSSGPQLTNYEQLERKVAKENVSQSNGQSTELPLDKGGISGGSSNIPPPPPPARP